MKVFTKTLTTLFSFCFLGLTLFPAQTPDANGIIYVKKGSTGNGSSWNAALPELRDALNYAETDNAITQIWVAKGTYYPSATNNRDDYFLIDRNRLKLYGGFSGNETSTTQREIENNPTILSGDIGSANNMSDNSYHIMVIGDNETTMADIDNSTVVDGFTFENGNSNAGSIFNDLIPRFSGSAIFVLVIYEDVSLAPLIQNCTFRNNDGFQGGAVTYFPGHTNSGVALNIINSQFYNNHSQYSGAGFNVLQLGLYGLEGSYNVNITGSTFTNNDVDNGSQGGSIGGRGAAVDAFGPGNLTINKTIFENNTTTIVGNTNGVYQGTAISLSAGTNLQLINSLVYSTDTDASIYTYNGTDGNVSGVGKVNIINSTLYNPNGSVLNGAGQGHTISNSILWTDNSSANIITGSPQILLNNDLLNANAQGTFTSTNLINDNPQFVNVSTGDFHLQSTSPAVNAGDNQLYNEADYGDQDLSDNDRIIAGTIDLGAYELQQNLGTSEPNDVTEMPYPNPTKGLININVKAATNATVFDLTGKVMKRQLLKSGKNEIDLTGLSTGVYLLNINNNSFKIIKR